MEVCILLLIFVLSRLIDANEPELQFENPGDTPALFFVKLLKYNEFYFVPNITIPMEKHFETLNLTLAYTCPASQDEIKQLKDSKSPEKNENPARTESLRSKKVDESDPPEIKQLKDSKSPEKNEDLARTESLSSTNADELDPSASPTRKKKPTLSLFLTQKESESEEDSQGSDTADLPTLLSLYNNELNNKKEKQDIYDDDYNFDLGEILDKLASKAYVKDIQWSTKKYFCQKDFRPQKAKYFNCARVTEENVYDKGKLYSISYRVQMAKNKNEVDIGELFVYAKCYKSIFEETLYVMYKIIPSPSAEEYKQIDYETFDPAKIYPDFVNKPYLLKIQKKLLKELDNEIQDDLIPQRLIPVYSIDNDYARGTVANDGDIFSPQWQSKAKIWDELSRLIYNHGKKLKWIIYTGTVGTLLTSQGNPVELKRPGFPIGLSVPLYWWTLIIKTDSKIGEGIIIGMLNYPKTVNSKLPKNIIRLCDTTKSCAEYGWGDIINKTNVDYIVCCQVIKTTSQSLIAYPLELDVLSLNIEKTNEKELTRVKVDNLMSELAIIGGKYVERKKKQAKLAGSPVSTPSSPISEDLKFTKTSPIGSPDRQNEISSPRSLSEMSEPLTVSKPKGFRKFFTSDKLPAKVKAVVSLVRSTV